MVIVHDPTPTPESPVLGVVYSTATRRIMAAEQEEKPWMEPRMGIYGPGPFPFRILPELKDHPLDYAWGLANGYINPDGSEKWILTDEYDDVDIHTDTPPGYKK